MSPGEHASLASERLASELRAELEALERLVARVEETAGIAAPRFQDHMALAALLQHYFTGVESMLLRIVRHFEEPAPTGPHWHRDLLMRVTRPLGRRPKVLSATSLPALQKLLGFRHFFRHAYAVDLDERELALRVDNLREAHPIVQADLAHFATVLEIAARTALEDARPDGTAPDPA